MFSSVRSHELFHFLHKLSLIFREFHVNKVYDNDATNITQSQLPGNFFSGNGTARLYIGNNANAEQRRELEAIFTGRKGGLLQDLWGAVFSKWLPTETTDVKIGWGEKPVVSVGDVGQAQLTPLKDQAGRPTKVEGAAAQAAFQFPSVDLASSKGSHWADPNLRQWNGDSGTLHQFNWSA